MTNGDGSEGLSRRWFLGSVVAAAVGITATTAGETVPWLRDINLLGARRPGSGQGLERLPVNKTAAAAGVPAAATDPAFRLRVTGAVSRPLELSVDDLVRASVHTSELPLTCVEGWSVTARWQGIRLRDLLEQAGATSGSPARVESLERGGLYRSSHLDGSHAWSPATLLATGVDGQRLNLDHGYPVRLFAPNRPGVLQTKWVSEVVVL